MATMQRHEASKKGGLATRAKYGASHFSIIGKRGGRPPLPIIAHHGTPREYIKNGGMLSAGSLQSLKKLWESHPLNPFGI